MSFEIDIENIIPHLKDQTEIINRGENRVDIILPSFKILNINYYIYRDANRKIVKEIAVNTSEFGKIRVRTPRARRQFLNHLKLGFRKTERVKDWKERNRIVLNGVKDRAKIEQHPLLFRCKMTPTGLYEAWSVVTKEYTEVPTLEAKEVFEEVLKKLQFDTVIDKEWDSGAAKYYRYLLYKNEKPLRVKDLADCGIIFRVGYSGDRSIGMHGYWRILTCANGMMSSRMINVLRLIHKTPKNEILTKLKTATYKAIDELDKIVPIIESARVKITEEQEKELLDKVLEKYPKHIQRRIKRLLDVKYMNETGIFKISQALTDLSTHGYNITENYRTMLAQEGHRILLPNIK